MADSFAVELDIRDEATRRIFETILGQQPSFFVRSDNATGSPQLVVLDMPADNREMMRRIQAVRRRTPNAEIFVTSFSHSTDDLVDVFREGVHDFIPMPLKTEEQVLEKALDRFLQRHSSTGAQKQMAGKVINLMGSKGGIGTTTLAVNLAISLKQLDPTKEVALVDLDLQFGDVALFLDVQPVNTIIHLAQNIERLDGDFVRRVLTPHASGVSILPAPNINEETDSLTPEIVNQILQILCATFDCVIVDSGHTLYDITMETVQRMSPLFLVSTLHLPVMRNTERLQALFDSQNLIDPDHIHLLINRYKSEYEEVALKDLQKDYQNKILTIPNDYKTTTNSIHRGKSFVSRVTPFFFLSSRGRMNRKFKKLALNIQSSL